MFSILNRMCVQSTRWFDEELKEINVHENEIKRLCQHLIDSSIPPLALPTTITYLCTPWLDNILLGTSTVIQYAMSSLDLPCTAVNSSHGTGTVATLIFLCPYVPRLQLFYSGHLVYNLFIFLNSNFRSTYF